MANLVIDIGNTYIKLAVFSANEILDTVRYEVLDIDSINNIINKYGVEKAIISTVRAVTEPWESALKANVQVFYFNSVFVKTIKNHYRTPQTLGADRLAGVVGAYSLYPEKNNLVIDGGTCITYDWIDAEGNYFGGSISPGLNMRYNALNYYTGALPVLNKNDDFNSSYGNDTATAITSGVQNGIKYELMGFIESYSKQAQNINIVLTGGDNVFLIRC